MVGERERCTSTLSHQPPRPTLKWDDTLERTVYWWTYVPAKRIAIGLWSVATLHNEGWTKWLVDTYRMVVSETTPNGAQAMLKECDIDNALIHQKDFFLNNLNTGPSLESVRFMVNLLWHNRELWIACSYGYKGLEVAERMKDKICEIRDELHHNASKQYNLCGSLLDMCINMMYEFNESKTNRLAA